MAYSYENELQNLKEAQRKSAIADLENTRNQTLSDLQAEQQKNLANYNTQRNTANVQNQLGARNFQEYLASTGRANSGLASQAKLQNDNNLQTTLNSINSAQNASLADINRRTTDTNNAYNTGLAGANANIEANYIQNLLNQRAKAEEFAQQEREMQFKEKQLAQQLAQQEKEFNESVRQFNEQMAYNYANLRGGSSGGSSGGGSRSGSKSSKSGSTTSNNTINWSNDTSQLGSGAAAAGLLGVQQALNNNTNAVTSSNGLYSSKANAANAAGFPATVSWDNLIDAGYVKEVKDSDGKIRYKVLKTKK